MQDRSSQTEALLNENIIDLGYYWQVLRRNLGWILILVVVSTTGAYLVSQLMKPMYRATATLLIDSKDSNVVAIQGLYGDGNHAKEYYLTQYEILQSRKLADRLVKRLDLTHSAEFDPRQQPGDWIDNIPWLSHIRQWFEGPPAALTDTAIHDIVVAKLSSDLDVEPVNNTQLININFETHDPVLATKLANTLADLYIQNTGEVRQGVSEFGCRRSPRRQDKAGRRLAHRTAAGSGTEAQGFGSPPAGLSRQGSTGGNLRR